MNFRKLALLVGVQALTLGLFAGRPEMKILVQVPSTSVKNQQHTGTCWSFATTSFLESELIRMGKGIYNLSEMYFVKKAYPEKLDKFLLYHGMANFGEGGQAHDVLNVIRKYGIVPDSILPGIKTPENVFDHRELVDLLAQIAKKANQLAPKKMNEQRQKFNSLLDKMIGPDPAKFNREGQDFDPKSFAAYLDITPDNYIEISSYTHHPFYKPFDLEVPDNWSHDRYLNVPVDELISTIDSALFRGFSVCWDGDTSEDGFSHKNGLAELKKDETFDQKARQETFLNRTTTDDHLMHLVGIAISNLGEKFYLVKNSWGSDQNELGGYMYLSEPYVRLKTIAILVNKDATNKTLKKYLNYD
jgi:bleomycin hydrolase